MIKLTLIVIALLTCCLQEALAADKKLSRTPAETKSIYTMNIARYTTWPALSDDKPATANNTSKPFVIGIIGRDPNKVAEPFKQELANGSGMLIKERSVEIIDLPKLGTRQMESQVIAMLEKCNLIFFSEDSESEWRELRALLKYRPIMTVSEITGFARQGGIVEYEYDEDAQRMYMIFNMQAIKDAGLAVSSTLLRLKVTKPLRMPPTGPGPVNAQPESRP